MTDFRDYRTEDIRRNLAMARLRPLDVMVTGVTGAGKSTTLNSLFSKIVAEPGNGTDPMTMEVDSYALNAVMRIWDTPGLGDGVEKDRIHSQKLIDMLYKTYNLDNNTYGFIDTVLVIIEGSNRDMGTTYRLLNEVVVPNFQRDRIMVAINQADVAMKGRHWDEERGMPDEVLLNYLENQARSVQARVKEATGIEIIKPVYYSAEKNYNIEAFYDMIIDNMPRCRRRLVS